MPFRSPALRVLLPLLMAVVAALPGIGHAADPVEGVDYATLPEPGRWDDRDPGRIEVVEVFGYWCHHCSDFAPMIERWKQAQEKDVRVSYIPLPRAPDEALSLGFFASQSIDALSRTHAATFQAIHGTRNLPANPTLDELSAFYAGQGVDGARFRAAAAAPATADLVSRARAFAVNGGVEGTPTLIVDGRYRVTARTLEDTLRIASALVGKIRAERD